MSFWKPGAQPPGPAVNEKAASAISSSSKSSTSSSSTTVGNAKEVQHDPKINLSKSVMNMKFMKRKVDDESVKSEEINKRKKLLEAQWSSEMDINSIKEENENTSIKCTLENGDIYSALPGRRSFGGFNKSMERYYQQIMDENRMEKLVKVSETIDDEEMINRYENLVSLPRGPNQGRMVKQGEGLRDKKPYNRETLQSVKKSIPNMDNELPKTFGGQQSKRKEKITKNQKK